MPKPIATQYQCRHLHADGRRCGSRSLRLEPFCYFHHTTPRPKTFPHAAPPQTSPDPAHIPFDLPHPEDRTAIQLSIGEILRRIALNQIDPRRAGLLLYGLQIASANLPKPPRQGKHSRSQPIDEPVDEIVHHPTHGPLAPQAEYTPEGERYSFTAQLLRQMEEGEDPEPQQNTPDPPTSATIQTLQATAEPSHATCPSTPPVPSSFGRPLVPSLLFSHPTQQRTKPLRLFFAFPKMNAILRWGESPEPSPKGATTWQTTVARQSKPPFRSSKNSLARAPSCVSAPRRRSFPSPSSPQDPSPSTPPSA